VAPARWLGPGVADGYGLSSMQHDWRDAELAPPCATSEPGEDQLRTLIHRLNNQLGVILAHAELLEAKAPDAGQRARAMQVVSAALQAMTLAREIRSSMAESN
jgi:hypothetical protein